MFNLASTDAYGNIFKPVWCRHKTKQKDCLLKSLVNEDAKGYFRSPMEEFDYKALGFRCGVEIHQQLATSKKLFCRCPAPYAPYSDEYQAEILRHMRPTLSEMGSYDGTALMEFKTRKEIIYRLNRENVCTYEMDDTPPFPINEEALNIAIEIALLLNSAVVDELHIARKQYLDGSIPTGFQRTAIVGMGGYIPYKGKTIRIRQVAIEEDACREASNKGHVITFFTDRLGIPLVEVVTEADMETPIEAGEVVREIGRLMRMTGKVRRGIGSVRQDVNVSIEGGRRVEIKGVPRYQDIPLLVHNEAMRQKALLEIRDEMKRRGIQIADFSQEPIDLTKHLKKTGCERFLRTHQSGGRIMGVRLPKMAGLMKRGIGGGLDFASEFSGRVRVIACIDEMPNLYHTDEWPRYANSEQELQYIKNLLGVGEEDVGVVVFGNQQDTITACGEILARAMEALEGVPHETRRALARGITTFERILPGPDRMYPDTDHPPLKIDRERIKVIAKGLPPKPWELEERYVSLGVPRTIAASIPTSKYRALIERLKDEMGEKIRHVAVVLFEVMKGLERKGIDTASISEETLYEIFMLYKEGVFSYSLFPEIIKEASLSSHVGSSIKELVQGIIKKRMGGEEKALAYAEELIANLGKADESKRKKLARYIMGRVTEKFYIPKPALFVQEIERLIDKKALR